MSVHYLNKWKPPPLVKPDFSALPNKQAQLVLTGWDLFNIYGIKKVSVEEICRTAGTSKVTFYKYFKNKIALLEFIFEELNAVGQKSFEIIMKSSVPMVDKLNHIIVMKETATTWISPVFYEDFRKGDNELEEFITISNKRGYEMMRKFFIKGQKDGEIDQDMSVDFMIHMIQTLTVASLSDSIKNIYGADLVSLSRDFMNFIFFGISGQKKR